MSESAVPYLSCVCVYQTLRGHFLFSGLGSADHDLIIDSMQRLQYDKGDVVFTQGAEQEVGGCYFIQVGT